MTALTKVFCTEHEQEVASFCAGVLGAPSMLDGRWARAMCYSPAYTLMGGTSQILRTLLAERVLGLRFPANRVGRGAPDSTNQGA